MKHPPKNPNETTPPESALLLAPRHARRILCLFPAYAWSFATFNYAFPLLGSVKAFMPPQGILLVAALAPARWDIRFIDENVRPATERDLRWADVVFTTGMHIQREQIQDVITRAHRVGRAVVLGGPSASSAPEWYPDADILHCGEVGDATRQLFELIDRAPERGPRQIILRTKPILEVIDTLNGYGIEVAVGLIMGFDTDTEQTPQAIANFIRASQAPIQTVNLLYALPKTPLYERLREAGRIVCDDHRDSNIQFLQPYEQVVGNWRQVIAEAYEPKALYQRYATQVEKTYPHRRRPKRPLFQATSRNRRRAFAILTRVIWRAGLQADYRTEFWSMFWTQLREGHIENIFQIAMVAHHLINYARDCVADRMHASNYTHTIRPLRKNSPSSYR